MQAFRRKKSDINSNNSNRIVSGPLPLISPTPNSTASTQSGTRSPLYDKFARGPRFPADSTTSLNGGGGSRRESSDEYTNMNSPSPTPAPPPKSRKSTSSFSASYTSNSPRTSSVTNLTTPPPTSNGITTPSRAKYSPLAAFGLPIKKSSSPLTLHARSASLPQSQSTPSNAYDQSQSTPTHPKDTDTDSFTRSSLFAEIQAISSLLETDQVQSVSPPAPTSSSTQDPSKTPTNRQRTRTTSTISISTSNNLPTPASPFTSPTSGREGPSIYASFTTVSPTPSPSPISSPTPPTSFSPSKTRLTSPSLTSLSSPSSSNGVGTSTSPPPKSRSKSKSRTNLTSPSSSSRPTPTPSRTSTRERLIDETDLYSSLSYRYPTSSLLSTSSNTNVNMSPSNSARKSSITTSSTSLATKYNLPLKQSSIPKMPVMNVLDEGVKNESVRPSGRGMHGMGSGTDSSQVCILHISSAIVDVSFCRGRVNLLHRP